MQRPAGVNESSEAETAGKTMEDENGLRKSKSEETTASESTTASASISVPTEAVETEHVDAKNDIGETKEQLSVKPTMELVQNEYNILKDGGVARDLIHFRSLDVPLGKLEMDFVKEVDNQPNEQSEALALVINNPFRMLLSRHFLCVFFVLPEISFDYWKLFSSKLRERRSSVT